MLIVTDELIRVEYKGTITAIPVRTAKEIDDTLIEYVRYRQHRRAMIGLSSPGKQIQRVRKCGKAPLKTE